VPNIYVRKLSSRQTDRQTNVTDGFLHLDHKLIGEYHVTTMELVDFRKFIVIFLLRACPEKYYMDENPTESEKKRTVGTRWVAVHATCA